MGVVEVSFEEVMNKRAEAANFFSMILSNIPELTSIATFSLDEEYQGAYMSIQSLVSDGNHDLKFWEDKSSGPSFIFSFWHGHLSLMGDETEPNEEKYFLKLVRGILDDTVVAMRDADNPQFGWVSLHEIKELETYFEDTSKYNEILDLENVKRVQIVSWSGKKDQVIESKSE